jgi:hypothetical protein
MAMHIINYLFAPKTSMSWVEIREKHLISSIPISEVNYCENHPKYGEHIVLYIDDECAKRFGEDVIMYEGEGHHSMWYKKGTSKFVDNTPLPLYVYYNNEFLGVFYRDGDAIFVIQMSNSRKSGWIRKFHTELGRGKSIRPTWVFPIVKG